MKSNHTSPLVIALLVILQVVSIFKIGNLQKQLESANMEISNMGAYLRNEINDIYANVEAMLAKQASPIVSASVDIGELNREELTVAVTYKIIPKEVSEHTLVSLDLDGELLPLKKNGTTFTVVRSDSVFGRTSEPKIIIDEGEVKKTVRDERIDFGGKESIFPIIYPLLAGESKFDGKTYERKGILHADSKENPSGIKFVKYRLVIEVADRIVSDQLIPVEQLSPGYELDEKTPIREGETYQMLLIATDSVGLEHHYILEYRAAGSDYRKEEERCSGYYGEKIYFAQGELLWAEDDF